MDSAKKFLDALIKVILIAGALVTSVLLISVFAQVIFRYIIRKPLSWSEELARFCFVWVSMLGAAATVPKSLNQGIDLVTKRLPANIQLISNLFTRVMMIIFCVILVVKGWELTTIVNLQTSAVMGIPMSVIYVSIPVTSFLMIIILGLDLVTSYKDITLQHN